MNKNIDNCLDFSLLNSIPVGICIIDSEYNVTAWNDTISEWTSIDSKDIKDKKLYDFFPKFQNEAVSNASGKYIFRRSSCNFFIPVS